ncbi:Predicted ATPase [Sinosporangium album]|uniref:Predicted ATPase n=1 Tax=Sinosporangium album TaxID=504805 RepID=A0A1G8BDA4_9ACTN|nr:BTAD domain-containing putative transcriptional regulator [Sinosporangium album]SDH31205.1 Predicted ATPase [Sinosporangium album]
MEGLGSDAETSFAVLGPLQVGHGGKPVQIGGRRLRALLSLLAGSAGKTVSSSVLVDGVWGESPPANVTNALQALVSRARAALAPGASREGGALVAGDATGYRLAVSPGQVDAHRFAALADTGRRALAGGDAHLAWTSLGEALALWRGPVFTDLADGDTASLWTARLEAARLAALEDRFEAALRLGRFAQATAGLPALVAAHPLRERLRAQLMRALYGEGRHVEALAAYEDARETFADRLGADPSPDLAAVHLAMLKGEWREERGAPPEPPPDPAPGPVSDAAPGGVAMRHAPAPPDAERTRRSTLPARLTSFVGRETDVAAVGDLLAANRLVTLLGPGGAGKTRLAVESAEPLAGHGRLPGGVRLVELAGVAAGADAREVAEAVSAAVGVRPGHFQPGLAAVEAQRPHDPLERLLGALTGRHLLIILDNCEHVIESAALVVDQVLAECPEVRVLVTSREPLNITGETLWAVSPLHVPSPGEPARSSAEAPAVRLFADRAAAVRSGFSVADHLDVVVRICRELDGMPLAIELAAARLRSMSPQDLADRLDDRFRVLTGGSRTALPRHKTLRAVVEWSWDLLDERERMLARRFGVFAGGARLAAAERVCGGEGLDPADVLDLLGRLVDKSLVTVTVEGGRSGEARYTMLETIRAYALERLSESGERERMRLAHAEHVTRFVEEIEPGLRDRRQLDVLAAMSAEHDNASAAIRWAVDAGRGDIALRLVGALGWYWWLTGHRNEAVARSREALRAGEGAPPHARLVVRAVHNLNVYEQLQLVSGTEAAALLRDIQESAVAVGRESHPFAAMATSVIALAADEHTEPDCVAALRTHSDPWVRTWARMLRGFLGIGNGRVAEGERETELALAGFEALGDRWGAASCLAALAETNYLRGRVGESADQSRAAIAMTEEFGAPEHTLHLRGRLAASLWTAGEREAAEAELARAVQIMTEAWDPLTAVILLVLRGDFARERGRYAEARRDYTEALALIGRSRQALDTMRAPACTSLAMLALQEGDLEEARLLMADALESAMLRAEGPVVSVAAVGCASLAFADGEPERAAMLLGWAARMRGFEEVVGFDHVRVTEAVRAALGTEEFSRCHERGRRVSREGAAALVR